VSSSSQYSTATTFLRALVSCGHSRRPRSVAPRVEVSPVRTRRKQRRNEWGMRFTGTRPHGPNRRSNSSPPAILEDADARLAANFAPMLELPPLARECRREYRRERRATVPVLGCSSRACRAVHNRNVEDEIVVVDGGSRRDTRETTQHHHRTRHYRDTAHGSTDARHSPEGAPLVRSSRDLPPLRGATTATAAAAVISPVPSACSMKGEISLIPSVHPNVRSRAGSARQDATAVGMDRSRRSGGESCGTLGSRAEFLWNDFLGKDEILPKRAMRTFDRFPMNL